MDHNTKDNLKKVGRGAVKTAGFLSGYNLVKSAYTHTKEDAINLIKTSKSVKTHLQNRIETENETYKQAVTRMQLTEIQLSARYQGFRKQFYICAILLTVMPITAWQCIRMDFLFGVLPVIGMSMIFISLMLQSGFRAWQMREHSLSGNLIRWLLKPAEWFPKKLVS